MLRPAVPIHVVGTESSPVASHDSLNQWSRRLPAVGRGRRGGTGSTLTVRETREKSHLRGLFPAPHTRPSTILRRRPVPARYATCRDLHRRRWWLARKDQLPIVCGASTENDNAKVLRRARGWIPDRAQPRARPVASSLAHTMERDHGRGERTAARRRDHKSADVDVHARDQNSRAARRRLAVARADWPGPRWFLQL